MTIFGCIRSIGTGEPSDYRLALLVHVIIRVSDLAYLGSEYIGQRRELSY